MLKLTQYVKNRMNGLTYNKRLGTWVNKRSKKQKKLFVGYKVG